MNERIDLVIDKAMKELHNELITHTIFCCLWQNYGGQQQKVTNESHKINQQINYLSSTWLLRIKKAILIKKIHK